MKKVTSFLLSKTKNLISCFIILFTFFITENSFSENHWKRDFIYVNTFTRPAPNKGNGLWMRFKFFDFEFGPYKEHGYLEWCDFEYSTDGEYYKTYARCEVKDQTDKSLMWVYMTNKLPNHNIDLHGCWIPANDSKWEDLSNKWVAVRAFGNEASLTLKWYLPDNISIKKFRVVGKWCVAGLFCPDYFTEIYDLPKTLVKSASETVTKNIEQKYQSLPGIDNLENDKAEVYSNVGVLVVKRAAFGKKNCVYSTSGALVNSMVADQDVVSTKLPANQMYIVKVGQARYKVAI